ncbi:BTAD domain-containing putative transcriptional regulator [Streptomyces sp. NPDC013157]|uniref:AfsR/SARP family transcriptional regulator n=1 Tax=Streptomyces sp. NPDC013157 TaxID=3364861 RepID=UPI0036A7F0C9
MKATGTDPLRFSLLGPLRAWRAESELELGSPQQRAVLAGLLLRRGRAAGLGDLVAGVWGTDPPPGAVSVLRTYVSRLRKLLEPERETGEPPRLVVSLGDGYALRTDAVSSDLDTFEEYVARAERHRAAGDPGSAADLLRTALGTWSGTPLAGVPGPYAEAERTHLDRRRLGMLETRLRLELELGRHEAVLPELAALRDAHPLRENVCELLLLALYRAGRQAEALEEYARTRRTLVDELGIEPGPSLRALHARILAGEGEPETPAAPGAVGPAGDTAAGPPPLQAPPLPTAALQPAQLPADLPVFTGRRSELDRVTALLPEDGPPAGATIVLVEGMAGTGKTSLAVHWAHRVADRFPDGALYVNLRGYDPSGAGMPPSYALQTFLVALGVPPGSVPDGLDAQAALYRSVLARRRVLIVLDNARDAEQVRPLLPGTPGCLAVVTSRSRLSSLVAGQGAYPLALGPPTPEEAREMLVRRLGPTRVAAEPEAADAIVGLCAGLPLALAITAARAAQHPGFRLADIADELRENHGGLDAFAGGDAETDARAVFSWSYRALPPTTAELFRRLALHPGPDLTSAAAAALAGVPVRAVRALLAELTTANLLMERSPGRFVFHDLLRAYATELAEAEAEAEAGAGAGVEREAGAAAADSATGRALLRLHDHYLRTAHHAAAVLGPFHEMVPLPEAVPGSSPARFEDRKQATTWLRTERQVLGAVVAHAAAHGYDEHAWRTACALDLYFNRLGYSHDLVEINAIALRAARALGDRVGQAHALRGLGYSALRLGRAEGMRQLEHALELFQEAGDGFGEALTRRSLAFQTNRAGRHDVSLGHYARALALYRELGLRNGEAGVRNEVGWTYILLGEHGKALRACEQAIAVYAETGDLFGLASAEDSLGYALHHLGRYEEAVPRFERSVELFREIGDRYMEADSLRHLGATHRAAGDPAAAQTAWSRAVALLAEAGNPEAEEVREDLRALGETGAPGTGPSGAARAAAKLQEGSRSA